MNATQPDKSVSKPIQAAPIRERLLNFSFALLYGPFAWLHEVVGWVVFGPSWSARRRRLARPASPHELTLDVGCGDGRLLTDSGWRGARRIGVEPSRQASRRAQRRGALVVRAEAQRLPLSAGSLARVVASYPGPWLLDRRTWDEFARVLRPGGEVCVLLGGVTTRGRGAAMRRLLQRVAYGSLPSSPGPRVPDAFRHTAFTGHVSTVDDAWGAAYFWLGQRVDTDAG